jgi:PAS domain S-box-containing protein
MPLIVVADDRPLNRHFLTTLLHYYGYEVAEAADGVEALGLAHARRPDLIIADVVMPRMDGPALARAVRADPKLSQVPIIFYSASFREEEAYAIAKEAGVDYVITKPSDPQVILGTVARALGHAAPAESTPQPRPDTHEYIGRLQLAGIRMTAVIELMAHLSSERDPHELLRTACRAIRKIFGVDAAIIVAGGDLQADGDLDGERLDDLPARIAALAATAPLRAEGTGPLIDAARAVAPSAWSALLIPMISRGAPYGWILLLNRRDAPAFSVDDESLAFAAASQIRAEHENLTAGRTERQRIENELRASREDLSALVEASPLPIVAFDSDGIVLSWNPAAERTFGWSASEVIGGPCPAVPAEFKTEYERLVSECLAGKTITNLEQRRLRKDGALLDVIVSVAPIHGRNGEVRGFVTLVNDMTALRISRERLRALSARVLSIQEEERSRFARELHDDLGQLLTAIKIDASRLLQDVARGVKPPPSVVDGFLPLIDSTLETVVRLVSELRPSRIGEMGLAAAIEKKLAEFRKRHAIEADLSIDPKTQDLRGEAATAAFRILEEALTNTARHSGATKVTVGVFYNSNELRIVIKDNGRGIREADLIAADAYGLIGMRERAVILGGSVEINSGEQRGTTVTARIPFGNDPGNHR